MPPPVSLQTLLPEELCTLLPTIQIAEARKLLSCVHRHGALPVHAPPPVRRESLAAVRGMGDVPRLTLASRVASNLDPFVKFAFESPLGGLIETVLIPLEKTGRFTVCVSSQIGCALGCTFCETGRMGLVRNLHAWEIVDQIGCVRADLADRGRIHGVVFQGMGEALANFENVARAAKIISEPCALAIDGRNVTISTAGLPGGIERLARELPKIRLALSIGSARVEVRRQIIPIERQHPLELVLQAAGEHARITRLAPLWAYTLLRGVNDTPEDADALLDLTARFVSAQGIRPRITLIPYNRLSHSDPFQRSLEVDEEAFAKRLEAAKVFPSRRYSGGSDVGAACGQLTNASLKKPPAGPPGPTPPPSPDGQVPANT